MRELGQTERTMDVDVACTSRSLTLTRVAYTGPDDVVAPPAAVPAGEAPPPPRTAPPPRRYVLTR